MVLCVSVYLPFLLLVCLAFCHLSLYVCCLCWTFLFWIKEKYWRREVQRIFIRIQVFFFYIHDQWIEKRRKKMSRKKTSIPIYIFIIQLYFLFPFFLFSFLLLLVLITNSNEWARENRTKREPWKYTHSSIIHGIVNIMDRREEWKGIGKWRGGVFGKEEEEEDEEEKRRTRREHYYCAVQSWPWHQQARLVVLQKSACLFSFSALCRNRERQTHRRKKSKRKKELSWTSSSSSSSWESTKEKWTSKQRPLLPVLSLFWW